MENQHRQITGYRDLLQYEIDFINEGKALAEMVGSWIKSLEERGSAIDQRWVAIGKTDLQKGFMSAIRSIAKPTTF